VERTPGVRSFEGAKFAEGGMSGVMAGSMSAEVVGEEKCLKWISAHGEDERIEPRMGLGAGVCIVYM
jgi:hypothetical protein